MWYTHGRQCFIQNLSLVVCMGTQQNWRMGNLRATPPPPPNETLEGSKPLLYVK